MPGIVCRQRVAREISRGSRYRCRVLRAWVERQGGADSYVTVPGITAPPTASINVKEAALSVEVVIASEKVAETEELVAMPVAAFAGAVAETVGGVESAEAPVVKLQEKSEGSALPDESLAAVLTVAEY